jgi:glycosyltransferase involved in cell wall biosynthesis
MACGLPVVATNVSDNAYVVPDGRVGYVVPVGDEAALADRICRLLNDAQLRLQMGRNARTWVEQEFSTSRLAEKTTAIYLEALNSKRDGK